MAEAAFLMKTGWTQAEYEATDDTMVAMMYLLMTAEAYRSRADG